MKRLSWQTRLGLGLILLSGLIYSIHYMIFRDIRHIFIYLTGDIAFLPIEVLFVTLIISQLLSRREKRIRLEKMNMVIGTFFSGVGIKLLRYFSDFDPSLEEIRNNLIVTDKWTEKEFSNISKRLRSYDYKVDIYRVDLGVLKNFLMGEMKFLMRLLENPNLLEHETFTELLRAVFHLAEELAARENVKNLPEADYQHLAGDIKRAYSLLVYEWLNYMKYLKNNYPYLFSLAMRTNPFDQNATPEIK